MNIFERASRSKLRFDTAKGSLKVEDLWGLTLKELDELAVYYDARVKATSTVSFIDKASSADSKLKLQFDIVYYVIHAKLADQEAANKRKETLERKTKIQEIIDRKKDSALEDLTPEELEAELAKL